MSQTLPSPLPIKPAPTAREPDYAGIEGMLMLWNAESDRERSREMALEMADRNRVNARSTQK